MLHLSEKPSRSASNYTDAVIWRFAPEFKVSYFQKNERKFQSQKSDLTRNITPPPRARSTGDALSDPRIEADDPRRFKNLLGGALEAGKPVTSGEPGGEERGGFGPVRRLRGPRS